MSLLLRQCRIVAETAEEAINKIRDKHGPGMVSIREAPVQPFPGVIWYDYTIEIDE